jgi:hypothetical protein
MDADVWSMEKVGDATLFGDWSLSFVGEAVEACGKSAEEIALGAGPGISHGAKPRPSMLAARPWR